MTVNKVALLYGLGGKTTDPADGLNVLATRLTAKGFIVEFFNHNDGTGVVQFLQTGDWKAMVGVSLGADYAPLYASEMKPLVINYVGGFQPSMYASDVRNGLVTVSDNVKEARCIRNPNWAETGGLGFAKYVAENPATTKLEETDLFDVHPGDWGHAQDIVFEDILRVSGVV